MFGAKIARPVACPGCGNEVAIEVFVAWRHAAGGTRERAGLVCECVACGARYTVLREGSVVRYGARGAHAGSDSAAVHGLAGAGATGGARDGGGGTLFADMETLD